MERLGALARKYRELILYVVFGVLTTLVNWAVYWLLADVLHLPYLVGTIAAQAAAILFAYVTNRIWVFESKVSGARGILLEMGKFFGARAASFFLDIGLMFVGVDLLGVNDLWMKLLANAVIIVVNYVLSKVFVFRKKEGNATKD